MPSTAFQSENESAFSINQMQKAAAAPARHAMMTICCYSCRDSAVMKSSSLPAMMRAIVTSGGRPHCQAGDLLTDLLRGPVDAADGSHPPGAQRAIWRLSRVNAAWSRPVVIVGERIGPKEFVSI